MGNIEDLVSKKPRYNPEKKEFKGVSYKKTWRRVRALRDRLKALADLHDSAEKSG
jgi:hypothetical protein